MNYEFNSKKFMILLIVVCIVFFIIIIKAFDYLPQNNGEKTTADDLLINTPAQEKIVNNESDNEKDDTDENEYNENSNKSGTILSDTQPFEEIQAPKGVEEEIVSDDSEDNKPAQLTPEEEALISIYNGKKAKTNKNYTEALNEFQKAANLTDDKELQAQSYEGIAEVYAINRKYGTALSFAYKAYNNSPSSAREMLIAKIYYKAGETDKAINQMNSVLKREF